ncbi:MAG: hypothetical protein IPN76_30160, partial [Saprospiraceae bacterium]|nr:hypothetical protein [Saprospiraceae bacterium]
LPEDGLFDPDVVPGGFVVGDGVVGSVAALPSGLQSCSSQWWILTHPAGAWWWRVGSQHRIV